MCRWFVSLIFCVIRLSAVCCTHRLINLHRFLTESECDMRNKQKNTAQTIQIEKTAKNKRDRPNIGRSWYSISYLWIKLLVCFVRNRNKSMSMGGGVRAPVKCKKKIHAFYSLIVFFFSLCGKCACSSAMSSDINTMFVMLLIIWLI